MAAQQIRQIKIVVDAGNSSSAIKNIAGTLKSMNRNVSEVAGSFSLVKNALIAFATSNVITTFTNMADSMQLLNDRVKGLLGSQTEATYAMSKLKDIAQTTKAPIDELAGTFARVAVATKTVGISSTAMLDLTQLLQNSFRLSGASAEEAAGSTTQFTQALSRGTLRGQELNSVISQNAILANVFRDAIKGSKKSIQEFAEQGGFTTKFVLTALAKNMDDINSKAGELGQTFSQTLTIAMNEIKIKVGEINKEFSLNSKFASFMQWILDNSKDIGVALTSIAAGITAVKVASIVSSGALATFVASLGSIPALIGISVAAITYVILEFDKVSRAVSNLGSDIDVFFLKMEMFFNNLKIKAANYLGFSGKVFKDANDEIKKYIDGIVLAQEKMNMNISQSDMEDYYSGMKRVIRGAYEGASGLKDEVKTLKDTAKELTIDQKIAELNKAFNSGRVSVEKYNAEILKLTEEKYSKAGPVKLYNELKKVKIESLTRQFEEGDLTLKQYRNSLNQISLEKLKKDFDAAKISASEYHRKLTEISGEYNGNSALVIGLDDYLKKVGTTTTMVAGAIEGTFDKLGDSLSNWIETGKFKFSDFAASVLSDLNKIIVKAMIIRPLAAGLLDWAGASSTGTFGLGTNSNGSPTTEGGFAKGGAFLNGVQFYAKGDIFNSPTMFAHGGGLGIMGEAGPEAVMPLTRGSDGKLGVKSSGVTVNIINNSGSDISQVEKTGPDGTRVLDVIISNKVKEGIASGAFDKTFQQAYGIRRRGN